MGTISAASAVVTLSQAILFPEGRQLQGFANDDVFDIEAIKSIEVIMGVDGLLSGGFVWAEVVQTIALQADSTSNDFFDVIHSQMQAALDVYPLNGVILLPSISTKLTMSNGFLTGYKPVPDAKRVLQPRRHQITWNKVAAAPM